MASANRAVSAGGGDCSRVSCGPFNTGLMQRVEQGVIQRLVPELAVEAFKVAFHFLVFRLGQSELQYGLIYRGKVGAKQISR